MCIGWSFELFFCLSISFLCAVRLIVVCLHYSAKHCNVGFLPGIMLPFVISSVKTCLFNQHTIYLSSKIVSSIHCLFVLGQNILSEGEMKQTLVDIFFTLQMQLLSHADESPSHSAHTSLDIIFTEWARSRYMVYTVYLLYTYFWLTLCVCVCTHTHTHRMPQEEYARIRENVPYVKVHRYNPKHLYPKLNGYGDNGQRSLKV
jgi:hypothetical protein